MQIRPLCLLAATPALRLAPPVMQMVSQPVSNFGYTPGTDYSQGFMQPAGNHQPLSARGHRLVRYERAVKEDARATRRGHIRIWPRSRRVDAQAAAINLLPPAWRQVN